MPPSPAARATPKSSATAPAAARTVTGTVASTQYGPMQVRVTLAGTKITKVTVLQRTDDGAESDQIDANAIPKLTSETLAAQSAHIDAVSGASYTSSGYIQSLQSALGQGVGQSPSSRTEGGSRQSITRGAGYRAGAGQAVIQVRSFSGLRTTQMCLIRSPTTSKAKTVTVTPSC